MNPYAARRPAADRTLEMVRAVRELQCGYVAVLLLCWPVIACDRNHGLHGLLLAVPGFPRSIKKGATLMGPMTGEVTQAARWLGAGSVWCREQPPA